MKKNSAIILLILITSCSMIYAYIKASEAEQSAFLVKELQDQVEKLSEKTKILKQSAEEAAAEAMKQTAMAAELRANCESKK